MVPFRRLFQDLGVRAEQNIDHTVSSPVNPALLQRIALFAKFSCYERRLRGEDALRGYVIE